ncbi:MAG: hypothetical protein PHR51_00020 [Patescibacteria group bacterium]|nr:hypothetical protein [Patescibacteria group bacterium]
MPLQELQSIMDQEKCGIGSAVILLYNKNGKVLRRALDELTYSEWRDLFCDFANHEHNYSKRLLTLLRRRLKKLVDPKCSKCWGTGGIMPSGSDFDWSLFAGGYGGGWSICDCVKRRLERSQN